MLWRCHVNYVMKWWNVVFFEQLREIIFATRSFHCPVGEIGRRATLRGWWSQGCAGSNPVLGTRFPPPRAARRWDFFYLRYSHWGRIQLNTPKSRIGITPNQNKAQVSKGIFWIDPVEIDVFANKFMSAYPITPPNSAPPKCPSCEILCRSAVWEKIIDPKLNKIQNIRRTDQNKISEQQIRTKYQNNRSERDVIPPWVPPWLPLRP